ncbi:MAG: CDP-alcohol phosphatidyltransferase family protein [Terriglobales bacterium]
MPIIRDLLLAPNQLTLLRLVFVPFIIINVLDGNWGWALGLFVAAGLSDGLDGLLARKLHQQTMLGQYLDPIADKLLLSGLFLVLSMVHQIAWRYTVLVFSRDICIVATAAVLYTAANFRDFRPSIFGKMNTGAQVGALFFVLLREVHSSPWIVWTRRGFLWLVFALTLISGIHYIIVTGQRVRAHQARSNSQRAIG